MSGNSTLANNTLTITPGPLNVPNTPYGLTLSGLLMFASGAANPVFVANPNGTALGTITLSGNSTLTALRVHDQ